MVITVTFLQLQEKSEKIMTDGIQQGRGEGSAEGLACKTTLNLLCNLKVKME